MTAGDGASFNYVDYGQTKNPCGDPPGGDRHQPDRSDRRGRRTAQPGRAHGRAIRRGLDGSVLRIDKATGQGLADNPFAVQRRCQRPPHHRLRVAQPVPGRPSDRARASCGSATWAGTSGRRSTASSRPTTATNFGWPCYEGAARAVRLRRGEPQPLRIAVQRGRRRRGGAAPRIPPLSAVAAGDGCPTGNGSAVAGLAFASAQSTYPAAYAGALFFADHNRNCIWAMLKGADGLPSASSVQLFMSGGSGPVDLQIGPGGDLFYAGFDGGDVRRISYPVANRTPTAVARATPTSGRRRSPSRSTGRARATPIPATLSATPGTSTATAHMTTPSPLAELDVHAERHLHRTPEGVRQPWRERHGRSGHHGRQHQAHSDHRGADSGHHMARRPVDRVPRLGHGSAAGHAARRPPSAGACSSITAPPAATRTRCRVDRHRVRLVHGSRSRVSLVPGARADRHRRGRPDRTQTVRLDPRTVDARLATSPAGLDARLQQRRRDSPVHPHGDRGLGQLAQRAHRRPATREPAGSSSPGPTAAPRPTT